MGNNAGFDIYSNLELVNWWLSYMTFANSGTDDCCLSFNE